MTKIFSRNLRYKEVMLTDGSVLGHVSDVIIDMDDGTLIYLMVKPMPDTIVEGYDMKNDIIIIPFKAVTAVRDYVIVDKNSIKE